MESANLSTDGSYRLPAAPVGQVRVAVQVPKVAGSRPVPRQAKSASEAKAAAAEGEVLRREDTVPDDLAPVAVRVPDKFQDPDTSGLVFEITPGQTELNIELVSS
jgi:hypothetical protein